MYTKTQIFCEADSTQKFNGSLDIHAGLVKTFTEPPLALTLLKVQGYGTALHGDSPLLLVLAAVHVPQLAHHARGNDAIAGHQGISKGSLPCDK